MFDLYSSLVANCLSPQIVCRKLHCPLADNNDNSWIHLLTFCKDRNIGYNFRKNDTQDFVPNFSRTDGFKYSFFNRVVDEWNGLPNHIRESNSIATFKRNVLSFIKDN